MVLAGTNQELGACTKVEYDTFVQWLYAPAKPARFQLVFRNNVRCSRVQDSKLSELVLSRASRLSHFRILLRVYVRSVLLHMRSPQG